jgi:hypothetical protein
VKQYDFPDTPEASDYRVFPASLENDPDVFFHGTNAENLESIFQDGFKFPPPDRARSVSYNSNSALCLGYACEQRTPEAPQGCIIAVRYERPHRPGLNQSGTVLHDHTLETQPHIVGWCIVPADYYHR